jgi:release factor glutamine methyltransferase
MRLVTFPGVLRPPSDAFVLAHQLRLERLDEQSSVLDLCTGSGVLAVVAAQSGAGRVTALDVSRRALAATRLNARLNGVRVRTVRGDLFDAVARERFDVIVSNPPYLVSASDSFRAVEPAEHGTLAHRDAPFWIPFALERSTI